MALNDKQRRFAEEYLIDLNATQAAIRAEYSEKTAYSQGQRLLKNDEVQALVQELMAARAKRTEITADNVLAELAKHAFLDPKSFFDDSGNLKNIHEIPDEAAVALAGLDVFEEYEGRGQDREFLGYTKKIKFTDKLKALISLGEHLGLFNKKEADQQGLGPLVVNVVYGKPPDKGAESDG